MDGFRPKLSEQDLSDVEGDLRNAAWACSYIAAACKRGNRLMINVGMNRLRCLVHSQFPEATDAFVYDYAISLVRELEGIPRERFEGPRRPREDFLD